MGMKAPPAPSVAPISVAAQLANVPYSASTSVSVPSVGANDSHAAMQPRPGTTPATLRMQARDRFDNRQGAGLASPL
jgi:hypothetical protein